MLKLLFVEDCEDDAVLAIEELRRRGLTFESRIVQTLDDVEQALSEPWSALISDYNLRSFNAIDVLNLARKIASEIPFIVVSGTIGEERAVDLIRAGANDYVSKDRLVRLCSALERELREAEERKEHRRLQAELNEAQNRYRLTFQHASIGIVNGDREARIIDVNSRFAEIVGYERHELLGRSVLSLSHPDDVKARARFHDRLIAGELDGAQYERRFIRKDGSVVWAAIRLTPIRGADGVVDQVIGLIEDITERREAEAQIALQAMLLDSVRQAVVATDVEGQVIYWNHFAEEQFGWSAQEATGRNLQELAPSDEYAVSSAAYLARLRAGEARSREALLRRRDGSRFAAWVTEAPIMRGGEMVGVIGIMQDIGERKRDEARLLRSERQLAEAQQIAKLGSWTHDIVTGERSWSDELFRLYGFTPAAAPPDGETIYERIHPEDRERVRAMYESAIRADAAYESEYRIVAGDGECRVVRSHARAEEDADGRQRQIVGVVQDVTESKHREEELQTLALKHAAAASLGQLALGGTSIDQLFRQALAFAMHLLHGDEAELLESSGPGFRTTSSTRRAGIVADQTLHSPLAEFVAATNDRVIVEDTSTETRFDASSLAARGIRSAVAIPMSIGFAEPWSVFGVYSGEVCKFRKNDADFLHSLAPVLGQAVESDKARGALVDSEENYRNVIQGAHEIIFTTLNGVFAALNPAFDAITGLSSHEWIGRPVQELIVPRDRERAAQLTRTIVTELRSTEAELTIHGAGGEILLHVNSFPKIQDGKVAAIYGFARDITEARRLEEQRQQLTRNLQLILDSTAEGIFTIDVDRRFTAVNRSLTSVLGWTAEELIGAVAHDVIHSGSRDVADDGGDRCAIHKILSSGEVLSVTTDVFWRKDGTPVPVRYSAAPIVDGEATVGVVVSFTDMSEHRKLEYKLEQATRLSSLGRLAATVAHEFNNVLMGISPFIEVLRRKPSPDRVELALDQIGRAVKRGKRITDDILRFTQPAEPARTAFDAGQWLQMLVIEARGMFPPQVSFSLDLPPVPLHVNADGNQLHQVFLNLVLNARDAMPQGGTIAIGLETPASGEKYPFGTVAHPERFAHFTIADSGCGIPSASLQHVFEPLFTTKKSGTGLGLAVAHQIVHRHGGEIFVESQEGVGTSFHVFLPLAAKATTIEGIRPSTLAAACPGRLLLVEDDRSVAAGLTAMLTMEGIEVEVAESGGDALASLARSLPDAVVLDVGLPDMEGTKVYAAIAELYPGLPVVFSTGHGDASQLEPFTKHSHVTSLRKPYDTATLLRALETVYRASGRTTPA